MKTQDIAEVGAAPRIDGLPIVPHHAQIFFSLGQKPGPNILRLIYVLILIN